MNEEQIIELFLKRPTEELISIERLKQLLAEKRKLKHYIGYEISGLLHLGSIGTLLKAKDLQEAGVEINIFIADYHSWINKKLGGDLELIKTVGKEYFIPFVECFGLKANYILASEIYDNEYWKLVLELGNKSTLSRVKRSLTIMGRKESESNPASFIIYPLMQAADIFKLNVDIAHAGMDQRKVHMLAIDLSNELKLKKPIALHTHILPALDYDGRMDILESKMSKSKDNSAIFIHDSEDQIRQKISKAISPPKSLESNPVYEILKWFIIKDDKTVFKIERDMKYGGDIELTLPEFEKEYLAGNIHPYDMKNFVSEKLIEILKPARDLTDKKIDIIQTILKFKSR
jgi:tyrosyl-tRNA synthetase